MWEVDVRLAVGPSGLSPTTPDSLDSYPIAVWIAL